MHIIKSGVALINISRDRINKVAASNGPIKC